MTTPPTNLESKKDPRWEPARTSLAENKSNVLENLKSNLDQLEELHRRLQFMLGEIKGLIRK
jgi:hypothetical protein